MTQKKDQSETDDALRVTSGLRELKKRLDMERLLFRIAARLSGGAAGEVSIADSLAEAGVLVGADRAYVFRFRDGGTIMDNTHEWCRQGVSREIDNLQGLPADSFPWFMQKLRHGKAFQIPDVAELPDAAAVERSMLQAQNIRSCAIMPMMSANALVGFVGFDNVREVSAWRNEDEELLQVATRLINDFFEREDARHSLESSLRRQQAILDNIPDIAWLKDEASRFIHVNAPFADAAGVDAAALVGKTDLDIWPRELATRYREDDRKVMASRRRKVVDEPLADKELGVRVIETIKTPVFDADGKVIGTTGIARDITDRKRIEQKLKESEARYRNLVEALPAIIYRHSSEKGASYWSPQVEEILGYSAEALTANPFLWHDSIHPDDLPAVDKAISEFRAESPLDLVYRIRDARGDWRWLHDRSMGRQKLNDETLIEGVASDITHRKNAEHALAAEREKARVTLSSIGDAVISTDAAGHIDFLNPIAENLTGWTMQEARGLDLEEVFAIFNEQTREPAPNPVARCLKEGKIVGLANHTVLRSRCGTEFAIEDTAAPICSDTGAVLGVVLVFKDVTENRKLSQQVSYQATHDALTGLINRTEFDRRLRRVLDTARMQRSEHALCYLDLDQFKLINDTCGHVAGDELLRQLGQLLLNNIRKRDTLARLGGDEFGLLMEHCSIDEARHVAENLVKAIGEFSFLWESYRFRIGASIGLVSVEPLSHDIEGLLSAADNACYVAKEQGRNRVHIHKDDDEELARRHGEMQWAVRLPRALEEDRFRLYCQPIVAVNSGVGNGTRHYEILLRMEDEAGDLVSPGTFLPAAERYSLSDKLDLWVIRNTFRWLRDHPGHLARLDSCSINLSGLSLGSKTFLPFVVEELEDSEIPPEKICFEITETAAIANLSSANLLIGRLRQLGCRFALDDFGSGLSSFAYLKNLPVDYLKIDGLFVKDIIDDPMDLAMVKSINEIGHVMGKQTIAEFVENAAILQKLEEIGVDYAQGYGIGRPVPIDDLDKGESGTSV